MFHLFVGYCSNWGHLHYALDIFFRRRLSIQSKIKMNVYFMWIKLEFDVELEFDIYKNIDAFHFQTLSDG